MSPKQFVFVFVASLPVVGLLSFSTQVAAGVNSTRVTDNLVSFYTFNEQIGNVVHDQSGSASPMDLTISGSVSWYDAGNGVVMNGGRVGTQGPATDMINALRASNASSFEIWTQPTNVTQTRATFMLSVDGDTFKRNFILGQVGDDVGVRLMHTGKQSGRSLVTGDGVLDTSLVHLVYTYDGSVERLYINGVQYSQTVVAAGGYGNWDVSNLFSIGNEARLNRPYDGIIRLVAVYDRSLGIAEIQQNFAAGPAAGANRAPVLSGMPAGSALTNQSYNFQPTASDADGNELVFSIDGKPAWANFDTATGRLSGSPTPGDAGTYNNIVISVSDETDTTSLGTFGIHVSETLETGSFTLSWTAPVARSDGTPISLADIAGFRIYYSSLSGRYPKSVEVADGSATSITTSDIPVGTQYIVMTTYDTGGRESGYSPELPKIVQMSARSRWLALIRAWSSRRR